MTGPNVTFTCGVSDGMVDYCSRSLDIEIARRDVEDLMQRRRRVLRMFTRCRHCVSPYVVMA